MFLTKTTSITFGFRTIFRASWKKTIFKILVRSGRLVVLPINVGIYRKMIIFFDGILYIFNSAQKWIRLTKKCTISQCKEYTFFILFVNVKSRNFQKLTKKFNTFSKISMMQPIVGAVKCFHMLCKTILLAKNKNKLRIH